MRASGHLCLYMNMEGDKNDNIKGRGLHLSHLNLRSIMNKHDLIKIQMGLLKMDLFTFSESWLSDKVADDLIQVEGYNVVRNDRSWNEGNSKIPKKGGGVGAYIHESLNYTTNTLAHLNTSQNYMENVWFEINRAKAKNMVICVLYRPPSGDIQRFCNHLTEQVNSIIENRNVELFVLGDFNINFNKKNDPDVRKLVNFQDLTTLKQIITQNTRNNNCIDLIFTNSDNIGNSGVKEVNISDHDLVYATHKHLTPKHKKVSFHGRSYRDYDMERFKIELQNLDWDPYWNINDPGLCWAYIVKCIENTINPMCPLRERKVKEKGEVWLTNEILELIFDKNKAWKIAKKSNKPEDMELAKSLRNQTLSVIRKAKANFVQEELNGENTAKKFWERINYVMPNSARKINFNLVEQPTQSPITLQDTAEYINNFFADIGPNLANKIGSKNLHCRK